MILTLRSALFHLWFAILSFTMNVGCLPLLLAPRRWVMAAGRLWANLVLTGLRRTTGLGFEIRGRLPEGGVLIAVKHFSMWETVAFQALFADPAIVIKRELLSVPFYGWYCRKMEMIAIDRDAGARAVRTLLASAKQAQSRGRPLIIFPEGTRKDIGDAPDYKPGIAALYNGLDVACVPVALNSGLYWKGFFRRPGKVVMEFLEPIPPGLARRPFMALLEARTEEATARLVAEGRAQRNEAQRNEAQRNRA
jgi:1-acyl-sn-glycerol-3-phosphate acyltransferase